METNEIIFKKKTQKRILRNFFFEIIETEKKEDEGEKLKKKMKNRKVGSKR